MNRRAAFAFFGNLQGGWQSVEALRQEVGLTLDACKNSLLDNNSTGAPTSVIFVGEKRKSAESVLRLA